MLDWTSNVSIRQEPNTSQIQHRRISVLTKDTLNCPDSDTNEEEQAPPLIQRDDDDSSVEEMDIVDDYNMAMNEAEITEESSTVQRTLPVDGGPFAPERDDEVANQSADSKN